MRRLVLQRSRPVTHTNAMLMPQLSAPPSPLCRSRLCLVKTEWTSELVTRFRELRGDVQAPPGLSAAASLAEEAATATAAAATAATAAAATAAATDAIVWPCTCSSTYRAVDDFLRRSPGYQSV